LFLFSIPLEAALGQEWQIKTALNKESKTETVLSCEINFTVWGNIPSKWFLVKLSHFFNKQIVMLIEIQQ
jgi:hypothetical protein